MSKYKVGDILRQEGDMYWMTVIKITKVREGIYDYKVLEMSLMDHALDITQDETWIQERVDNAYVLHPSYNTLLYKALNE